MIVTILPSSTNFHAVGYNERKVAKGVACLVEMKNFGRLGELRPPTTEELTDRLINYSSRNQRIRKPQFHVAISCKGHEQSVDELLDFAHRYLHEMGYDHPEQPLLVYAHNDTDNTHLHIITSRVAPDGKKLDHSHERRRSQQAIDNILGTKRQQSTEEAIANANTYAATSFAQFKAVMTSMGYEVYKKDNQVFVKHGGMVQKQLPLSDIEAAFHTDHNKRARGRQLRSILMKYRDVCANKEELQKEMKAKFGVDIVFFGRRDAPFGYMLVDHSQKTVINGAHVLGVDELLDFATPEERFKRIEDYINQLMAVNAKITQGELFIKLRRYHAYIKKGVLYQGKRSQSLQADVAAAIDRNNRIAFVEKFNPTTESERNLLCHIYKVNAPEMVTLSESRSQSNDQAREKVKAIFEDKEAPGSVRKRLYDADYVVKRTKGEQPTTYAINFKTHTIVELNQEDFDQTLLQRQRKSKRVALTGGRKLMQKPTAPTRNPLDQLRKPRDGGQGASSANREWEVGQKGGYDDVDDGRSLKR